MATPEFPSELLRFGVFELDLASGELRKKGVRVKLQEQPYQVLAHLAGRAGVLVTRDELRDRLWPSNTFVDFNNSLNIAVAKLRDALGDTPDAPRFLETVPRRGYRFIAPVERVSAPQSTEAMSIPVPPVPPPSAPAARHRRAAWAVGLLCVAIGTVLFIPVSYSWRQQRSGTSVTPAQVTTNSSEAAVISSALSPDGRQIAYIDPLGLHLRTLAPAADSLRPLPPPLLVQGLETPARVSRLEWFPEGDRLLASAAGAYPEQPSIWSIPLDSAATVLREDAGQAQPSPDGQRVAFVNGAANELWIMRSDATEARRVLAAGPGEFLAKPCWYPDGTRIAFGRSALPDGRDHRPAPGRTTIESLHLETGYLAVILADPLLMDGSVLPDGRLLYAKVDRPDHSLARVSLWEIQLNSRTGGAATAPREIAVWPNLTVSGLTVDRSGRQIAFRNRTQRPRLYIADWDRPAMRLVNARPLTLSDSAEIPGPWSADSATLFFLSDRNGSWNIFQETVGRQTATPVMTSPEDLAFLRLSPDGQSVLYFSFREGVRPEERMLLMRSAVTGGSSRRVADLPPNSDFHCGRVPGAGCVLSEWDHGQLVFYGLDPERGKGSELGRVSAPLKSGPIPGDQCDLSPDGSRIALLTASSGSDLLDTIRLFTLSSRVSQDVPLNGLGELRSVNWMGDASGWLVASQTPASGFLSYAKPSGEVHSVAEFPGTFLVLFASPSPDGRRIAFPRVTITQNVWVGALP
jgi:DNA-binding winged helix-turn-helix (wHTH) protein/Tol biopolymer transport system component